MQLVIETYVTTATPVGSEVVARKLGSTLSSATIRNVMMDLERIGFLVQPHTSAGRIPTQRGYRFYVDAVMDVRTLTPEQRRQIQDQILAEGEVAEISHVLDRAAEVVSALTQEAAFVIAPTVRQSRMRQVELVQISTHKLLCVMVASDEMYSSHVVEIQDPLAREELVAVARFINSELAGQPFEGLLDVLQRRLLAEQDIVYHLVKRSLAILDQALSPEPIDRMVIEGMSYVVGQPEFQRDPVKARSLLQGLEAQDVLAGRLREDVRRGRPQVRIGQELQVPGLEPCSYVVAPFAIGGRVLAGIGVLGPIRMDYPRMAAIVSAAATALNELLATVASE